MAKSARPMLASDDTAAFTAAVHEGVAAADAGRTMPFKAVRRWLLFWAPDRTFLPLCP